MIRFFMPMIPPTITHQAKKLSNKGGKLRVYNSPELEEATEKLKAHLAKHVPAEPLKGPIYLKAYWNFPIVGKHQEGEFKTSKPDTDNIEKVLKDVMTKLKYWSDDAQVCCEYIEKRFSEHCGIYIELEELEG